MPVAEDVERAVAAAREAFDERPLGDDARRGTRAADARARPGDRSTRAGAGRDRVARQRQAGRARRATSTCAAPPPTCATSPAGRPRSRAPCCRWRPRTCTATPAAKPVGVCAQIIPWNFPLLMASWKLGPALAAGCTVVLKPAEQTPLSALRLGELALEVGFPPGVLNVITGDGEHRRRARRRTRTSTRSPSPARPRSGREIGAKAGRALKRVTLELGGKSPNIILPDADIEAAVKGSFQAIYFNSGQACNAGSRLFVPAERFDEVMSALAAAAAHGAARAGPRPRQRSSGRSSPPSSATACMGYIESGREEGAELLAGGEAALADSGGYFVAPTLFSTTSDDLRIAREEIFGPVLVASPYDDARGGRRARQRLRLRPRRGGLDARRLATPTGSPRCCAPAWSTSTPGGWSTPPRRSAASRRRASAASTATTASTPTWRPRRSGPLCEPRRARERRRARAKRGLPRIALGALGAEHARRGCSALVLVAAAAEIVLDGAARAFGADPRSARASPVG